MHERVPALTHRTQSRGGGDATSSNLAAVHMTAGHAASVLTSTVDDIGEGIEFGELRSTGSSSANAASNRCANVFSSRAVRSAACTAATAVSERFCASCAAASAESTSVRRRGHSGEVWFVEHTSCRGLLGIGIRDQPFQFGDPLRRTRCRQGLVHGGESGAPSGFGDRPASFVPLPPRDADRGARVGQPVHRSPQCQQMIPPGRNIRELPPRFGKGTFSFRDPFSQQAPLGLVLAQRPLAEAVDVRDCSSFFAASAEAANASDFPACSQPIAFIALAEFLPGVRQ